MNTAGTAGGLVILLLAVVLATQGVSGAEILTGGVGRDCGPGWYRSQSSRCNGRKCNSRCVGGCE